MEFPDPVSPSATPHQPPLAGPEAVDCALTLQGASGSDDGSDCGKPSRVALRLDAAAFVRAGSIAS